MQPSTTLEQWLVLYAVVTEGSFAKAAARLNRSQSSVSYALNLLQERLDIQLLEVVGRKAQLTDVGRTMLAQALPLLTSFTQLESRAHALRTGIRAHVWIIVDSVFPKEILFASLKRFQGACPQTAVHVSEILRTESEHSLLSKDGDLYITTLLPDSNTTGELLLEVDFVAVASSEHPLHDLTPPISSAQLAQYPLVSISDRSSQRSEIRRISSMASWSFSTIEAAIEAVCHGVGYGWLPEYRIRALLASGKLKRLAVANRQLRKTPLYLVRGDATLLFDATISTLAEILRDEVRRSF